MDSCSSWPSGNPGMTLLSLSVTVAGVAKAGADIIKAGVDIKRAANTEATAAANTRFKNITWASRKIAGTASLVPLFCEPCGLSQGVLPVPATGHLYAR